MAKGFAYSFEFIDRHGACRCMGQILARSTRNAIKKLRPIADANMWNLAVWAIDPQDPICQKHEQRKCKLIITKR